MTIEGLTKAYGSRASTLAVTELDLAIHDGEFVVLLGPSGCGKTTTLRCLAGLEQPTAGRISLAGTTVFDSTSDVNIPPNKRSIGMMFQSYALWPHMTVRRNIEYPLRARKLKPKINEGWVEDVARLVECEALLDRHPMQLSGGQQQRVALARGLVARPNLLLLDEPLSNLDARLRDAVRVQLHELHRRLGFTAVFVTHDQSEALALGDRLAIMRAGQLEQFDTPERLFEQPASEYVADFVGMTNTLTCHRVGGEWMCDGETVAGRRLVIPDAGGADYGRLRIRPDDVGLFPGAASPRPEMSNICGRVVSSTYGGRQINVIVAVAGERVHAQLDSRGLDARIRNLGVDEPVWLSFREDDARWYAEPLATSEDLDDASPDSNPTLP